MLDISPEFVLCKAVSVIPGLDTKYSGLDDVQSSK